MPKDKRIYINLAVDMDRNPKYINLTDGQKWLIVKAIMHCREYPNDGNLPLPVWVKMGTKRNRISVESCGAITIVASKNVAIVHDYAEHNQTIAEIEKSRNEKIAAGQKGGKARAANRAHANKTQADGLAAAKQDLKQNQAEIEIEKEKELLTYVSSSPHLRDAQARPRGVRDIAEHLNGTAHSAEAHIIARAYSESCPSPVPGDLISKIAQAVDGCLKSGVSREQIEAGIQDWAASPMTAASMIPGFVHKSANRAATPATTQKSKSDEKVQGFLAFANPNTRKELA
ncbi:hypothetical protein [Rhodococcus qingshengii]|uniref:Uncharacterized protein n=1 Tax=Rhodococcus qingshengii TaxID=334542 RepID=A0A2A5JEX1_RHOSG|nr:hypothetical protein [Rhodococcus qingshengii]PCK27827.1 hypothetical protein CHR55_10105 [Rhodococcus qingshengii]